MAIISYNKRQLIQRIERHLNNNYPGEDWKISEREMLLYIDACIPVVMKGQMFENAKVTGFLDVPEAYLVTYNYTITTRNQNTREWSVTLAQPPLALPTGYDITACYIADQENGKSKNGLPISAKRSAYRDNLPSPPGFSYRIEGNIMYLKVFDGSDLLNYNLYVQLPISRTDDLTAELRIPDDAIDRVFDMVVQKVLQREQVPQDTVKDNLPQGNKTS